MLFTVLQNILFILVKRARVINFNFPFLGSCLDVSEIKLSNAHYLQWNAINAKCAVSRPVSMPLSEINIEKRTIEKCAIHVILYDQFGRPVYRFEQTPTQYYFAWKWPIGVIVKKIVKNEGKGKYTTRRPISWIWLLYRNDRGLLYNWNAASEVSAITKALGPFPQHLQAFLHNVERLRTWTYKWFLHCFDETQQCRLSSKNFLYWRWTLVSARNNFHTDIQRNVKIFTKQFGRSKFPLIK